MTTIAPRSKVVIAIIFSIAIIAITIIIISSASVSNSNLNYDLSLHREEVFYLNEKDTIATIIVGPGTYHRIWANKEFVVLSKKPEGEGFKEYKMPSGYSGWVGGKPKGLLKVVGLYNSTTIKFTKLE
jgi:hypothetical protein